MLDAGVGLRDVQIAARHAEPRTTMCYGRARKNLDRHPNYILAAYMASGMRLVVSCDGRGLVSPGGGGVAVGDDKGGRPGQGPVSRAEPVAGAAGGA